MSKISKKYKAPVLPPKEPNTRVKSLVLNIQHILLNWAGWMQELNRSTKPMAKEK